MDSINDQESMTRGEGFHKNAFLKQGGLFGHRGEVFFFWGKPQVLKERPPGLALLTMDFHDRGDLAPWRLFPHSQRLSLPQAQSLFKGGKSQRSFRRPSQETFAHQFQMIQGAFQRGEVEKVVPYVFEKSPTPFSLEEKERTLHALLQNHKGYLYGLWDDEQGFMGLSPELLVSQLTRISHKVLGINASNGLPGGCSQEKSNEGLATLSQIGFFREQSAGSAFQGFRPKVCEKCGLNPTQFQTMALAGTMSLKEYGKNPHRFLTDPKENHEHQKVVQDLISQLQPLGRLSLKEKEVETTPHLAHLKTEIHVEIPLKAQRSHEALFSLVKRLHPTPALGCFPRVFNDEFMGAFEKMEPRGVFGAPFGLSLSQDQGVVIVAIRNIIWNQQGLKLGAGCGVVKESLFEKEWQELAHKRNSVKNILGFDGGEGR